MIDLMTLSVTYDIFLAFRVGELVYSELYNILKNAVVA
jgi:hypothetical protein